MIIRANVLSEQSYLSSQAKCSRIADNNFIYVIYLSNLDRYKAFVYFVIKIASPVLTCTIKEEGKGENC